MFAVLRIHEYLTPDTAFVQKNALQLVLCNGFLPKRAKEHSKSFFFLNFYYFELMFGNLTFNERH